MPTLTADAVLRAAADLLDANPALWGRDWYLDPATGCRCTGGLIAYAINPDNPDGDPYALGDRRDHPERLLAAAAITLFEAHVTDELFDRFDPEGVQAAGEPLIGLWNDRCARDAAHVAETMRAAARRARAATLADLFTQRGATPRSWICDRCRADVDSADLAAHVAGHQAGVA